jgi:hypothetical protein
LFVDGDGETQQGTATVLLHETKVLQPQTIADKSIKEHLNGYALRIH